MSTFRQIIADRMGLDIYCSAGTGCGRHLDADVYDAAELMGLPDAADSRAIGKAGDALRRLATIGPKGRMSEVIRGVGQSNQDIQSWIDYPPIG